MSLSTKEELCKKVDVSRLESYIKGLTGYTTRHYWSAHNQPAAEWIANNFQEIVTRNRASGASVKPHSIDSFLQRQNIYCHSPGTESKLGNVLVCAHFDSYANNGGPNDPAPGADDNASGVSVMLEVANVLTSTNKKKGILFAALNGEEIGMLGATALAKTLASDSAGPIKNVSIDSVINIDMVGYNHYDDAVLQINLERHRQGSEPQDIRSRMLAYSIFSNQKNSFNKIRIGKVTDLTNSDHKIFRKAGFACVGFSDNHMAAKPKFYHTQNDDLSVISIEKMKEVTKLMVSSLVDLCKI